MLPLRMHSREQLSVSALAFRSAHAGIALAFLTAITYVWWCALTGRKGPTLRLAIAALAGEGVAVVANRGDCPSAGLQRRLGDPVPLFELVLSPKASRRAVPVLGVITAAGVCLVVWRDPRRSAGLRGSHDRSLADLGLVE